MLMPSRNASPLPDELPDIVRALVPNNSLRNIPKFVPGLGYDGLDAGLVNGGIFGDLFDEISEGNQFAQLGVRERYGMVQRPHEVDGITDKCVGRIHGNGPAPGHTYA
ncbi:MAG: hypothetical protein QG552_3778 [Thermodesulfobacteriota bacterium]|nr:hypothetical protein [Thermodesulfobacteriota bacterium]